MKVLQAFDLIVTAAGSSTRFNNGTDTTEKKECSIIDGRSVLSRALLPFLDIPLLRNIVITYPEGRMSEISGALSATALPDDTLLHFVKGGMNRTQSVRNAVLYLSKLEEDDAALVAVHDGARPFVTESLIKRLLYDAERYGASAPALKLTDAVKRTDGTYITSSEDRNTLVRVQTPQIFTKKKLIRVYSEMDCDASFQDDVEPYLNGGNSVFMTEGDEKNIKITYHSDLEKKEMRIGFGNDIHRLVEGRKLYIGGVCLPHTKGEEAHSDGDVLIHAVIDAVLGAYALGDIGHFFPPEDGKWKDADSRTLLRMILDKVNPEIISLDSTITLEGFRLAPYILQIRESLSSLLGVDISRISVKAKTNEGLDALGEGKAVKAEVVLLVRA